MCSGVTHWDRIENRVDGSFRDELGNSKKTDIVGKGSMIREACRVWGTMYESGGYRV